MKYETESHLPNELSKFDLKKCKALIKEGGAVDFASAERQLGLAKAVAVVRSGGGIVAVGVIKYPRPRYASGISMKSGYAFDKNMLELGYVARDPSHRGQSLSEKVVSSLLSALPDTPLFATTSNEKMIETLKGAGFVQRGKKWQGARKNQLSLWVKEIAVK
jgi:hypothetical protein